MNLESVTNEIKERVPEGTKPSDLKKKRGRPSKQNSDESNQEGITSQLQQPQDKENERREMFKEWIKENSAQIKKLDDNLAIFATKLSAQLKICEKNSQTSWWKIIAWSILAIFSGVAALASIFVALKKS